MEEQWVFSPNHCNPHSQRPTPPLPHSVPAQVKEKYRFGFGMAFLFRIDKLEAYQLFWEFTFKQNEANTKKSG